MNEFDLLKRMRDEVPDQTDLRGVELRLAEIRAGRPPTRRRRLPRLRWGLALVACTAAVIAWQAVQGGTTRQDVRPAVANRGTAAVVLEKAALVAMRTRATEPHPDQWLYIKQSQHMAGGDLPTNEIWHKLDGTKTATRAKNGELRIADAEKGPTHPGKTLQELQALPADPDALLEHFRTMERDLTALSICQPECPAGTERDVKAFGAIGWYMRHGALVPPDKAAAMYRALAKIPNVTIEENATDGDGRTGIGVVLDLGPAGKGSYILDARDYRYLGLKVQRDGMTSTMSVLGTGIVDEPGQTP
ncbi:CU044_5270 family protein [Nonomuraea sp. SYSU D8015]|uniref:CU044_5270 family protein n=1 Tax=Nonomuraea sp. SYSU D8015 TaxID=2593644 RepID=UPI001660DD50|nr:CU044_5270 family protein [Nonomuraea sp. SYSU D8015]